MSKTIAIIGAMDEEIAMYLDHIENKVEKKFKIFTFYEGTMHNHKVIVVKSGVGKVFASMITQYLLDHYKIDTVLVTGVGGSLNKDLKIGDVVVSTDSVHHDFDATPLGYSRGQISYTDYRFFEADKELLELALKADLGEHKIIAGRILTGDQFFTQKDKEQHKYLTEELKGDSIEMEGAAVAQVCNINDVAHLIIRTVSDQADGKAVEDYKKFTPIVAENSFRIVEHILRNF